ncbi:MAG: ABC transporter ATP-binding protein [Candidatus Promineifilaceae bacterium]
MLLENIQRGDVVLEARGISKRFGSVLANDNVDFAIKAGEIHAILGENGAGKSTLMKILFGQYQPDEGEIFLAGKRVQFKSPLDAIDHGIGMVYQHRKLINAHSVLENILLGHPRAGRLLDLKRATEEINALCEHYGFTVDLQAKVWQLSEGEKQVVEILKTLYRGAEILIMDEPSSALTPLETEKLLQSLEVMSDDNLAIVPFITHKLPIVLRISDRVTVMRKGKVVSRLNTADASEKSLTEELVGRDVIFRIERVKVEPGRPILEVKELSARSDKGIMALNGVSFTIREGEIFGVAGVSGNGQTELVETLAGLRTTEGGAVHLDGVDITNASSADLWRLGMGYIPADRVHVGSIPEFTLAENSAMNYYYDRSYYRGWAMNHGRIRALTQAFIDEYDVAAPGPDAVAKTLSGGNLQKMILARVLSRNPRLVIVDLPTQGLDIGATEFVRNKLIEAKQKKAGILLLSEDLDEILVLSDWVAPIYEGKFIDVLPGDRANRENIGAMMAGIRL